MGEIGEQGWRERHIVGEELPWEKEEHGERPGQADTWQLEFGELRGRGLVVDSDQAREAGRGRSYGTWILINGTLTNSQQCANLIRWHFLKKIITLVATGSTDRRQTKM